MLLKDRNALDEFRDLYKNAVDAQKKKRYSSARARAALRAVRSKFTQGSSSC